MKKYILLLFTLILTLPLLGQLEVKEGSFKEVPGFVNINTEKMYDDNDKPYAVLKIKTENISSKERHELNFKGDAQTFFEVEYKDGEVWLYISYYATFIKISHDDFSSTEFHFPFDMKPKCGYELTLVNTSVPVSNGWASLTIKTKPENGADIVLNGRNLNQRTPYTNDIIPPGIYEIVVSKYRFETTKTTIDVLGESNNIVEIDMPYVYGTISVLSDPSNATIYIDGKNCGVTPATLNNIIIGTHELKLEKSGCASIVKNITLDDKLTINEKLPTGKKISITTDCDGDKIFVDEKYLGLSPITTTLSYGTHTIKASRDKHEIRQTTIINSSDDESNVKLWFPTRTFTVNGVVIELIAVKGGTYTMGCNNEQKGNCEDDELPAHTVTINDYYIGKYEVTQELWIAVMGEEPTEDGGWTIINCKGDKHPAYRISWDDCQRFINKLNILTGQSFRLPTEAEWEYAAKGGSISKGYNYSGSNNIETVAWYRNNSSLATHSVGTKQPNELGIYDMTGNVFEWCIDWKGKYSGNSQIAPQGAILGDMRVLRGGSCYSFSSDCRVERRSGYHQQGRLVENGLRLVFIP